MPKASKGVPWGATIVLLALFVWGLEQVGVAPLVTGEIYPPYSSLRTDPLGSKALYDSLAGLRDLLVMRLYKPRRPLGAASALLILGVDPLSWDEIEQKTTTQYENLVSNGGRLVLAFLPVRKPSKKLEYPLLLDRWHVGFHYRSEDEGGEDTSGIPRDSSMYFEADETWTVDLKEEDVPVVIERHFGAGTIVLVAQSYPLSNEGLRDIHDAKTIATLLGPARQIIFDENHFGIVEAGSVTTLMRKYHLEPAILVLLVVAFLFLWRSASSLLPARNSNQKEVVAGRDAQEGLISLLERSITEKNLIQTCYTEWIRTAAGNRRTHILEAEISRHSSATPVEIYRAACQAVQSKTK